MKMESADELMQSFLSNIEKVGYIEAALHYYTQYSELIGKAYKPEEMYLNAMANILVNNTKVTEALNLFELATTIYPQSVNAHLSYGEALIAAKQSAKGIKVYAAGYDLAKKTNEKDVLLIEANLNKLKANTSAAQRALPPPPPPPRGGH
jgi:predicted Zn-dependent protease